MLRATIGELSGVERGDYFGTITKRRLPPEASLSFSAGSLCKNCIEKLREVRRVFTSLQKDIIGSIQHF